MKELVKAFNAEEIVKYLRLHPYTIRRFAREKKIPAFRAGGQWRFRKDGKFVKIELFEPFKRFYKELKCSVIQTKTSTGENSYILEPTDDRWLRWLGRALEILKRINALE